MPKGLKPVRRRLATGELKLYWYHRATGARLEHDPETTEGLLEIKDLDAQAATAPQPTNHLPAGSFASLWVEYAGDPKRGLKGSPEWLGLKPRTRSDYQAVRDWIGPGAERMIVKRMTSADVIRLRDKAFERKGRRFANYVVQVVRLVIGWGGERDWLKMKNGQKGKNPAEGVKLIRKPTSARKVNRRWEPFEIEAFVNGCPLQLLVMFALGLFAGMREGDAISVTKSAYNGMRIDWTAGKNGEDCSAPVEGVFKEILDHALATWRANKVPAVQIALTSFGTPWTESGFRASFFKRVRTLTQAGAMKPGCTFHGLRHTIGSIARDEGHSESHTAAAIGDRSPAMAQVYGQDAEKTKAQMGVLGAIQKRFENIDWKTTLENVSKPAPKAAPKPAKKAS